LFAQATTSSADERFEHPYFVTYDHSLEEPHKLEVGVADTTGIPKSDRPTYTAPWLELEYGVTNWWASELYLEGVAAQDGSGFTGWRWENRFRPFAERARLNPVLYVEYEQTSEASRIQTEVAGTGDLSDDPLRASLHDRNHELEGKLILSSDLRRWNISENFIVEKNLTLNEGVEFGYSAGAYHLFGPRRNAACEMCAGTVGPGIEVYGGLGSTIERSLAETQHYVAPVVAWRAGAHATIKASAGFGMTHTSERALLRVGVILER
jgi:hypothetical protein